MIRIRIEFVNKSDLIEITNYISEKYTIIEKGKIKDSQKKESRFKFQFLDLMKKEDVNE